MDTRNHHFISQWGLSHAVNDIYWFVLPSILPLLLEQFGLSYKSAGVILTLYLGAIALFSFIFGKLTDSLSPFTLIGGGFLIASLGFFLLGWAGNVFVFIFFLFVAASGVSTYHPAAYALVSDSTDKQKGTQLGNFEFWGALGIFIMFLLYGALLQKISWRGILYVTAFPGIIIGYCFLKIFPRPGKEKQPHFSSSPRETGSSLSLGVQILFFLALALRILSITAIVNFAPTYLVKERAFSPSSANLVTGVLFLGGMLATLVLGRLVDRFPPFPFILWISALTIPIIWVLAYVQNAIFLMILFFLLGSCWLGFMPAQNYILSSFSSQGKGQIFGLMMAATTLTNAFAPGLFGLVADRVGISSSIRFFSLFVALSFLIFLLLFPHFSLQRHS